MSLITRQELLLHYNNPSWEVSFHDFNGRFIPASFCKKINLWDVISRNKNKFVCDSNSSWKEQAAQTANRGKLFIISKTTMDEQPDFYNNLLKDIDYAANGNVYIVGVLPYEMGVAVERLTKEQIQVRDPKNLQQMSKDRVKGGNQDVILAEQGVRAGNAVDKRNITNILSGFDLNSFGAENEKKLQEAVKLKANILQLIDKLKFQCYKDLMRCNDTVYLCYAALLLETDNVGKKTRIEFSDEKRNVFGDIALLRDALWLNAKILSNDGAIKRMSEYLNLPKIQVVGIA